MTSFRKVWNFIVEWVSRPPPPSLFRCRLELQSGKKGPETLGLCEGVGLPVLQMGFLENCRSRVSKGEQPGGSVNSVDILDSQLARGVNQTLG